jgi:hypothetical protein
MGFWGEIRTLLNKNLILTRNTSGGPGRSNMHLGDTFYFPVPIAEVS